MVDTLFAKYGYCEIPIGADLYRMGGIDRTNGALFSLHPHWALNHRSDLDKIVRKYRTKSALRLPFLVSHLAKNGFPVGAIKNLYRDYIDPNCEFDDVAIKFENRSASKRLREFLTINKISGWLSSMEGNPPLEIFLVPTALDQILLIDSNIDGEDEAQNTLRTIEIFPTNQFLKISKTNFRYSFFDLSDQDNLSEEWFSIFEKMFLK
jgi:hypothetical protein